MPVPVVVKFATAGAKEVAAVFDTLQKKIDDFSRAQVAAATRAGRATQQAAQRAAKAQAESARQGATQAINAEKQAERERVAAAVKAARTVAAEQKRIDNIRKQSATMAGREAKRAADAEIKEAKRAARESERSKKKAAAVITKRADAIAGTVGGAARSAVGTMTGSLGMLGAGLGVGAVASGLGDAALLNRRAVGLQNMTSMPGATAMSADSFSNAARSIASKTGVKSEDIMSAMEVVGAQAGGAVGLQKLMGDLEELTKLAVSAGVSMEDMGSVVAAAMKANVQSGDDMLGLVRSLIAQGKAGAIEFRDFAEELSRLGGAGSRFGSGSKMLQDVGGLAQIASQTAIGGEGSRTTVLDMMREFSQGPKIAMLNQMGVKVNDSNGLRNPAELLAETIDAVEQGKMKGVKIAGVSAADRAKMSTDDVKSATYSSIFTGRSKEITDVLSAVYKGGYEGQYGERKGKKYTGAEAIRAKIEEASRPFQQSAEQSKAEYEAVQRTMALARAQEDFKNKMAEMLPQITQLIPKVAAAAEAFAKFTVWTSKNPFEGLGVIFTALLTKEIAAAGIGKVFEAGITNLLSRIAGQGGTGGVLGALGAAGTIALTAGVVYLVGEKVIDKVFKEGEDIGRQGMAAQTELDNAQREVAAIQRNGGTVSPEMIASLKGKSKAAHEAAAAMESGGSWTARGIGLGVSALTGGLMPAGAIIDEIVKHTAHSQGANEAALKMEAGRMDALIAALEANTSAVSANGGAASPSAPARNEPASRGGVR